MANTNNDKRAKAFIAEAVYQLASGDPKELTGRIAYAAPFLEEMKLKPSELV